MKKNFKHTRLRFIVLIHVVGKRQSVATSVSKHGAQRPQKPYVLLVTGRRGEGGMEVGGEGDYIPIATLSPPE